MLVFDKNHEEAVQKAIKSGREVAKPLGLFGTGLMRKSLVLRHAPGVIRRHAFGGFVFPTLRPGRQGARPDRSWTARLTS